MVVIEKEDAPARHQTSHNSGVIHSGVYYAEGSAKARLCVQGRRLLLEHLAEHAIPFELCGKLVVAVDEAERPQLRSLEARGRANGVEGLRVVGPDDIRAIEPHIRGAGALVVPGAGITSYARVAASFEAELRDRGVAFRYGSAVTAVDLIGSTVRLVAGSETLVADAAIACAGLQSDLVARLAGASPSPRIVPFRGDYYVLRPERAHLVRALVYPVSDPRFPFLGVHFTRRMDGPVWLGPNAVLAFAREGYGRADVNVAELAGTLGHRGFQRLALRYWRTGLAEMRRDYWRPAFLTALRRYLPELTESDLLSGPSGVRAQALDDDGRLLDDFAYDRIGRFLNVRNAPSPAATSSLALAREFADQLEAALV